jgi:acetyl esterase/lipase
VLWIHGGGFIVGSPQLEAFGTARLARDLEVITVSPEYRLAPEHPFPAALDDCMAALRWMRSNADELGIDPDRIAVMGASAGGGLSAAVAQRSYDEGISLRAQVLVYRCSTTAPRCARTAPAAAGSCGHPHPTCSAGPATWVARHACRTRRSTRHRRGAKI